MNRVLIVSSLLVSMGLAGCGFTTATRTFGPSGKDALSITCRGAATGWGACYERAGDACGRAGYDVLARDGEATPFAIANGYSNIGAGSAFGFGGSAVVRTLLIQCKGQP